MLYEVAILDKMDSEDCEELVFGPQALCADSAEAAKLKGVLMAKLKVTDMDDIEVLVRPFVDTGGFA